MLHGRSGGEVVPFPVPERCFDPWRLDNQLQLFKSIAQDLGAIETKIPVLTGGLHKAGSAWRLTPHFSDLLLEVTEGAHVRLGIDYREYYRSLPTQGFDPTPINLTTLKLYTYGTGGRRVTKLDIAHGRRSVSKIHIDGFEGTQIDAQDAFDNFLYGAQNDLDAGWGK